MQVRYYNHTDLADVCRVAANTLREKYDPSLFVQLAPFWREGLIVMEDMGRVVAFVFGIISAPQQARILMLAVDERYRNAGFGTLLCRTFFQECAKRGIRQITLEVRVSNISARRFYMRLGFFNVNRILHYYSDGEDGYTLIKYL